MKDLDRESIDPSPRFRWSLRIYAVVFLGGACVHGYHILTEGFLPPSPLPIALHAYWSSLFLFDLLAAALVQFRRRSAIYLAVAIMASDIAVNIFAAHVEHLSWPGILTVNLPFILFGGFVFGTARSLLRDAIVCGWRT